MVAFRQFRHFPRIRQINRTYYFRFGYRLIARLMLNADV